MLRKRWLRITVLIAGGIVATLLAYVHTPLFRGTVERRLAAAIEEGTGREATVRLARLRPLALLAQVEEIRIAGRNPGGPLFVQVGDSTVNARLLPLLTGKVHLSEVTIAGLLIDGADGWPEDLQALGKVGDIHYLVFPQGGGRVQESRRGRVGLTGQRPGA